MRTHVDVPPGMPFAVEAEGIFHAANAPSHGKGRRHVWSACSSVAALLCLCNISNGQTALDNTIENVRAQEQLYRDFELVYEESYQFGTMKRVLPGLYKSSKTQSRAVLQKGLIYLDQKLEYSSLEGKSGIQDVLEGYDGEKTRVVQQRGLVNLHHGRFEDTRIFYPHIFLYKVGAHSVNRLSELLSAKEYYGVPITWQVMGQESVDGLRCVRLQCDGSPNAKGGPVWRLVFWLATERNYLLVQYESYRAWTKGLYTAHAEDHGQVLKLEELEPGVWFPMHTKTVVYDLPSMAEDGKVVVANSFERIVKKASLKPNYDISLFREIPIPPGVPIYEISDGEIVARSVTPSERLPPRRISAWFVIGNLLLCLLAVMAIRHWRRARHS